MSQQNQAVATSQQVSSGVAKLKQTLNASSVQEQFKNALKENSGAFVASLIDLYNNDNQLQACNPNQVVQEALKAAVMKLPISKALGFAYILVFNNNVRQQDGSWAKVPTPTFVPGYKGYIQLAMRTGQYKTINSDFVYEGELRKVNKLSGEIAFDGDKLSDKVVGYFCYFELLNGFSKTLYMSVEDMAAYAKQYAPAIKTNTKVTKEDLVKKAQSNYNSGKVGWEGNFNDMALKTVVRRLLSKYGYLSIEMQNAMDGEARQDVQRNEAITDGVNSKKVNVQDINYEEVSTNQPISPNVPEADNDEGPGY